MAVKNPDSVEALLDRLAGVEADGGVARDTSGGEEAVLDRRRSAGPPGPETAERRALDLIGLRLNDDQTPADRRPRQRVPRR